MSTYLGAPLILQAKHLSLRLSNDELAAYNRVVNHALVAEEEDATSFKSWRAFICDYLLRWAVTEVEACRITVPTVRSVPPLENDALRRGHPERQGKRISIGLIEVKKKVTSEGPVSIEKDWTEHFYDCLQRIRQFDKKTGKCRVSQHDIGDVDLLRELLKLKDQSINS